MVISRITVQGQLVMDGRATRAVGSARTVPRSECISCRPCSAESQPLALRVHGWSRLGVGDGEC